MNNFIIWTIIIFLSLTSLSFSQEKKYMDKVLQINNHKLYVETAETDNELETGMMHRTYLPDSCGMLFIFNQVKIRLFWMKNTIIPLSIAFLDENMTIINIQDLTPLSQKDISSFYPCKYAIEVNQGWFKTKNIIVGDSFVIK